MPFRQVTAGMRFYLDCEWNDFRGPLISMALVPDEGPEWYIVLGCKNPTPWVREHVMPKLQASHPIIRFIPLKDDGAIGYNEPLTMASAQVSLQNYLSPWSNILIVADWPEDVARFCDFVITGPGQRLNIPNLRFAIAREEGERAVSRVPHNALEDARALKRACLEGD